VRRFLFWLIGLALIGGLCWLCPPFRIVPLGQVQQKQLRGAFDAPAVARAFWDEKLLPATARAVPVAELLTALAQDPGRARQRFGRTLGLSSTICLFVQGSGRISAMDKESISVNLDDVPAAIGVRLSTGLLFGNTVRDATGLLDVNEFPNSQDFNAISAELNRLVETQVLPALRNHAAIAKTIRFAGCIELEERLKAVLNEVIVTVGPFTSMPCAGEMPSDRYSPAGRPVGVAIVTLPAGTWKVIGMMRTIVGCPFGFGLSRT